MKHLLFFAVVAFAPGLLRAADRLSVQASFFRAAPGKSLPHDFEKLHKTKGVQHKIDRTITKSGEVAQVQTTLPFVVGPQIGGHGNEIATGCIVRVTPVIKGDRVT